MSAQTAFRGGDPQTGGAKNIANAVSFYVQRLGFTKLFQAENFYAEYQSEGVIHPHSSLQETP